MSQTAQSRNHWLPAGQTRTYRCWIYTLDIIREVRVFRFDLVDFIFASSLRYYCCKLSTDLYHKTTASRLCNNIIIHFFLSKLS